MAVASSATLRIVLEGQTLKQRMLGRRLNVDEMLAAALGVADGPEAAHAEGSSTVEARQMAETLTPRRRSTYVPASALASVHAGLGNRSETVKWIARAVEGRDPVTVTALKISPAYDPLRPRPAHQALAPEDEPGAVSGSRPRRRVTGVGVRGIGERWRRSS